jgi:transaldolase
MKVKTLERPAEILPEAGLGISIFLDGASLPEIEESASRGVVEGFTTNPTLAAKAGVTNYREFARRALELVRDEPISFEVIADDLPGMARQAREIASWGRNVFVKVPICNTQRESSLPIIRELAEEGLHLNVTAVMTLDQVRAVAEVVNPDVPSIVSIFAGRIADTGRDPCPIMKEAVTVCRDLPLLRVLWASPREVLNVYQAEQCGVDIIVLTADLLAKLSLRGRDLEEFSRDTVQMFYDDAMRAGYVL